jgi:hypothetical protein
MDRDDQSLLPPPALALTSSSTHTHRWSSVEEGEEVGKVGQRLVWVLSKEFTVGAHGYKSRSALFTFVHNYSTLPGTIPHFHTE